jgi:hypothetical protein
MSMKRTIRCLKPSTAQNRIIQAADNQRYGAPSLPCGIYGYAIEVIIQLQPKMKGGKQNGN